MNNPSLKLTISPTEGLSKAWNAITSNFGPMVGFTVLYFIASTVVGKIPVIGSFKSFFDFVFSVSLFSAFDTIQRYGSASFNDLFKWTPKFGKLLAAYIVEILMAVVLFIPALILAFTMLGTEFIGVFRSGTYNVSSFSGVSVPILTITILLFIIGLILLFALTAAFMFIVQFKDLSIGDSLKLSFKVGRENFGELVVAGLLSTGVLILGMLALFIGLIIAVPVAIGIQYYLLRSIFPADEIANWDFMQKQNSAEE